MAEHPITPPPDLVRQWWVDFDITNPELDFLHFIATQAARWGADQELEACVSLMLEKGWMNQSFADNLRSVRRPEPPSLKAQALDRCNDYIDPDGIIRRALEQLDD